MSSTSRWLAEQLRTEAVKLDLAEKAADLMQACSNGHELPELVDVLAGMYRDVLEADPATQRHAQATADILTSMVEVANQPEGARVITGIPTFDDVTRGISLGEVLTIVARPRVGKSALGTQIALNAAMRADRVVFFSLEMPREQAISRLIQQACGVDDKTIETWAKAGWSVLTGRQQAFVEALKTAVIVIDRGRSGIEQLDAGITQAAAILKRAPRLAIVDYLGLIRGSNRNLKTYERVSETARELKDFAKKHKIALVVLCQAGRDEDRKRSEGAGPLGLDSARDSGVVEEATDFLLTMWRPELDSNLSRLEKQERKEIIEASLVKNRRGEEPGFKMRIDRKSTEVTELAREVE